MSENPLEDDPHRDRRIRERAYHLWNDEGRPLGRDQDFWERARELVAMEESAGSGRLANPQAAGADPLAEEPVEEAFLQENLGEFPDRFADQGEAMPTPLPAGKPRSAPKPKSASKPPAGARKTKPKG